MQLTKYRGKTLVILLAQILTGEDQQSISGDQLFYLGELIVRERCTQVDTMNFSPQMRRQRLDSHLKSSSAFVLFFGQSRKIRW